jgi:hypothetical protein
MILNILSLSSLAIGSLFALIGILHPSEWITLVAYVLGLHAAGTAGVSVAKPAGEYMVAKARDLTAKAKG